MKIGCVKEIKTHEYRVGMTPDNAAEYIRHSHEVFIEKGRRRRIRIPGYGI